MLTEPRRHVGRVNWLSLARLLQIEVHHEQTATGIERGELVTIRVELDALHCSLLWVGLRRWVILVEKPLVEALVGHLVEAPHADQALGVAREVDR